jgi:hypothetical protein
MNSRSLLIAWGAVAGALLAPAAARAHVTISSGVAFANTTQEVTFGVGHGCAGVDTSAVRIEIPAGVTSVRPEHGDLGAVSVESDATGAVTAVLWRKPDAELFPSDIAYYKLVVRLKVPNQPFTTLPFPTHQTCKAPDGTITIADWVVAPSDPAVAAGTAEPAPQLVIVPARQPGWNSFTVPVAAADPAVFFPDALIVWKGTSAYSVNPSTASLIAVTAGVAPLTTLTANDQLWVRY